MRKLAEHLVAKFSLVGGFIMALSMTAKGCCLSKFSPANIAYVGGRKMYFPMFAKIVRVVEFFWAAITLVGGIKMGLAMTVKITWLCVSFRAQVAFIRFGSCVRVAVMRQLCPGCELFNTNFATECAILTTDLLSVSFSH